MALSERQSLFERTLHASHVIKCPNDTARPLSSPLYYNHDLRNAVRNNAKTLDALLSMPQYKGWENSHGVDGTTLCMHACRLIGIRDGMISVLNVLLSKNCDVEARCDAHRNVLHDLFWGTPHMNHREFNDVLAAVRMIMDTIPQDTLYRMLCQPDNHSFYPLDYLGTQNWERVFRIVISD